MKKFLLPLAAFFLLLVSACKKDRLDEVQSIKASFQLNFAADAKELGLSLKDAEITLTNKTDGKINKGKSDQTGNVTFESITPGNYSVVASLKITATEYSNTTGTATVNDIVFNGSLETNIVAGQSVMQITLQSGRLGDWVIKQVYYGGSSTSNGALFRDQFIEIYNNSNEVLYADGLYISQIHGKNDKIADIDVTSPVFQSNGQFNWANSIGMNVTNANNGYVYLKSLFMIPGTGKEYAVQPGASIIIAQNAQNHKSAYTGADGKSISVKDPSLTIDLSKADFETYYGNLSGINPLPSDADNPTVPNVKVLVTGIGARDMILNNNGYEAIIIFKSETDPMLLPAFPSPEEKAVSGSTVMFKQFPVTRIIDGVDIAHTTPSTRGAKRIPDAVDAGFTFTLGGAYSSQSVIRKTSKTVSGRRILKDTNNSTADFDYLTKADETKTIFK